MKDHQKNLSISVPLEMAEYSGFAPGSEYTLRAEESLLAVTPKDMTAIQLVQAIGSLIAVNCELIGALRDACGECTGCQDGCPFEDAPEPDAVLSTQVREKLGIPQDHKLHVEVFGGKAHISDAGYEHDITDVPAALLNALALAGTCRGHLDELLTSGEVVYHG